MPNNEWKPWWERVNDYLLLEEREEFTRGAMAYRPNNKQDIMISLLGAGYINGKFAKPESIGKKSSEAPSVRNR